MGKYKMKHLQQVNVSLLFVVLVSLLPLTTYADESTPSVRQKLFFDDQTFDFELQRVLGVTFVGGADINECLDTANQIIPGDYESWYSNWRKLADTIYQQGETALTEGRKITARAAYKRACNYYRAAEFFLHGNPDDPRILETWGLSRSAFRKAAELMDYKVEIVDIPYENSTLPGYFIRQDDSSAPRKTLIIQTGFDGTAEELFFTRAAFALERNYTVLIFEGPGQGGALREQQLYFRPDWDKVLTPVVDYLLKRKEVDSDRIALMGISMGGYLVSRAAAYEHRLAAVVANPGSDDLYVQDRSMLSELKNNIEESNGYLQQAMAKNLGFRWFVENGMYSTNSKSPAEFLIEWSKYAMDKQEVKKIQANTLVIASTGDHFMKIDCFKRFFDRLQSPKTFMLFSKEDHAVAHCQEGALAVAASRIFDWLDKALE